MEIGLWKWLRNWALVSVQSKYGKAGNLRQMKCSVSLIIGHSIAPPPLKRIMWYENFLAYF